MQNFFIFVFSRPPQPIIFIYCTHDSFSFESRDWSVFKFKEWDARQAFWTNLEYAIIDGPSPRGIPEDQLWPKAASAMVVLGYCAVGCLFTVEPQGQNKGWDHPGQHKRQSNQPAPKTQSNKFSFCLFVTFSLLWIAISSVCFDGFFKYQLNIKLFL